MAFNVTGLTNYTNEQSTELVIKSLFGSKTAAVLQAAGQAEDLVLFVGIDTFKKYTTALRNSNLFHYAADSEGMEILIPATNVRMIAVGGLSGTNRMFLARLSNLFVGTDLANEEEEYRFWYSQDNDEVRFRATMKYGVQIAFPDQLVQFTLA
jgi:hypothetical protein